VKVRFTPTGRTQLLEAIIYIYRDNLSAAVNFREKAEKVLSRLKKYPESGGAYS
jgi:toxin ParE1/3/4